MCNFYRDNAPPWNQRIVEPAERREQEKDRAPRGNFTGQRLTLGHAYFREESKQNCMVGATLCTHAAQSRHVEITLRDRFFFVAFPVNGQRAPRRAPSKLEIAVFNAYWHTRALIHTWHAKRALRNYTCFLLFFRVWYNKYDNNVSVLLIHKSKDKWNLVNTLNCEQNCDTLGIALKHEISTSSQVPSTGTLCLQKYFNIL